MKKIFIISILVAQSAFADFYVQYDNKGQILGTVTGTKAPIVKDRNQITFTAPVDVTGMMIEISKVEPDKKYSDAVAPTKLKVDPSYKIAEDAAKAIEASEAVIHE